MDLKVIKVGYLEENCYIISSNKTIIIDPGDEADKIIKYLIPRCKNAKFGFTNDTLNYVKNYKKYMKIYFFLIE